MQALFLLSGALISLFLWIPSLQAEILTKSNPIYKELAENATLTTGEIVTVFGVPCVEVKLDNGETIMSFVYSIPLLKQKSHIVMDRIALINRTHYVLTIDEHAHKDENMKTNKNKIFVPLDYAIEPKILPEFFPAAADHEKFILISRRQQFLGLYEKGKLKHVFPISSGTSNSTPIKKFVVSNMDEYHNSSLYDWAEMDLALNIGSNYFIHEGIVPGYPASHGCIRIFPLHARFIFYKWAKPGTPGQIID